ncbi:hypothetical protein SAMN02745119_03055 [Trichlorobacter thiogenes]|uniref:Uncharacterized protein n=1 Tax=Trichlorobacter thiogenes TaxID=115783 RepID=A0A1T4RT49_9BACT|nr:hypothetical protein [Trichlorobacter thiogenes]SKA19046.1 hypothetical protein SAMN02745119_03055 [Trichlorobacter thiogenes]
MPLPIDRAEGKRLFKKYRSQRDGIRNCPEMASVCLICESIDVVVKPNAEGMLYCRNCGFAFYRYSCPGCGKTVDGRDPGNPSCSVCGLRICSCGTCGCPQPDKETHL